MVRMYAWVNITCEFNINFDMQRKEGALILINDRLHPKENAAIYRIYWPFDDRITRSLIGKPNNPYIQLKQINDQRVVAKK